MNLKTGLLITSIGLALSAAAKRPNIVVIMSDDQDWRHLNGLFTVALYFFNGALCGAV